MEGKLDVRPISGSLGAEVYGVDLENLTDEGFEQVHGLLMEHLVLFFPDAAGLSASAHKAFGRWLGELEVHPFLPKVDGHDEIVLLDSGSSKADMWHTDVTCNPSPPIASILQIVQGPRAGGDTMWSNQYLAYEAVSDPIRDLIDGLTAVHSVAAPNGFRSEAEHPVVRVHPVTGRRSLYVNRTFTTRIPQLSKPESEMLLNYLYDISERPERVCRYRWQPGAVALWDNRATQHYAINDYVEHRVGQRVTVIGDKPQGNEPKWKHYVPKDVLSVAELKG